MTAPLHGSRPGRYERNHSARRTELVEARILDGWADDDAGDVHTVGLYAALLTRRGANRGGWIYTQDEHGFVDAEHYGADQHARMLAEWNELAADLHTADDEHQEDPR